MCNCEYCSTKPNRFEASLPITATSGSIISITTRRKNEQLHRLRLAIDYLSLLVNNTESEEAVNNMERKLEHLHRSYTELQHHLSTH